MSRLRPSLPWFRFAPIPDGIANIADSGVTTGKIADCAVTTQKINDSAVTFAKIQTITAQRILGRFDGANGQVQEIKLGTGLTWDSDSGSINATPSALADCGVTNQKLADCSVDSTKLADSAVTSAGLSDSSVITSKMPDCAVTFAKIQNITASRLLGRKDVANGSIEEIALSAELRFDTVNDWMEIADCGIITALLADGAVDFTKIKDSAVYYDRIADCGVRATELADSAVITAKMSDCAVTSAKLGDSAVSTIKINDGAVTASKLSDTSIPVRVIEIHATDTSLAVGDTLATFFIPAELNGYDLIGAYGAVKVVSTSGRPTIQIRNVTDSADMLVNKITLDSGEKTSYTADTAFSIDTANDCVETGNEIAIDIDSAGTGTEDLYVILSFIKR